MGKDNYALGLGLHEVLKNLKVNLSWYHKARDGIKTSSARKKTKSYIISTQASLTIKDLKVSIHLFNMSCSRVKEFEIQCVHYKF